MRSLRTIFALVLVLAALAPLAAAQVERLAGRPEYVERLDLPVVADAIVAPVSVTADVHTGEVFVCDLARDRIVIFGPDGGFRYQIVGGDVFRAPRDVAVDPQGYLYVAANVGEESTVVKLDFDGLPLGRVELSGLPEDADVPRIRSLALSPGGDRLFLLDEVNKRLWIVATETGGLGRVERLDGRRRRSRRAGAARPGARPRRRLRRSRPGGAGDARRDPPVDARRRGRSATSGTTAPRRARPASRWRRRSRRPATTWFSTSSAW